MSPPRIGAAERSPNRPVVLLRYTLVIATAYLLLVEKEFLVPPVSVILLIAGALASNVVLASLDDRLFDQPYFSAGIVLFDTIWITTALLESGRFSADFFYLYFFVLLLAAIGESLRLIVLGAFVVCVAYIYLHAATGGTWSFWSSPSLIRIPFLFSVAACYGHLVDRVRRERERALQADRIKSEFLATLSHELRTPINVIVGYADLLLDNGFGALQAEQNHAVQQIRNAAYNLHKYVSHILDESRILARIQTGQDPVRCTQVRLDVIAEELRHDFGAAAGSRINWHIRPDLPVLQTDPDKLRVILRNLIENAVKYCPNGSISVEVGFNSAQDRVELRVADTGIGIREEDLPHIFEPFYRAQSDDDPQTGGIGLGLHLVKQLVAKLRGEIRVSSMRGRGTMFLLSLPRVIEAQVSAGRSEGLDVWMSECTAVSWTPPVR